jgi:hypothetical protein
MCVSEPPDLETIVEAMIYQHPAEDILAGIRRYLAEHFPDSEVHELDAPTGSVIFRGDGEQRFHLEVTETFL